jgi:hypothetical protein
MPSKPPEMPSTVPSEAGGDRWRCHVGSTPESRRKRSHLQFHTATLGTTTIPGRSMFFRSSDRHVLHRARSSMMATYESSQLYVSCRVIFSP